MKAERAEIAEPGIHVDAHSVAPYAPLHGQQVEARFNSLASLSADAYWEQDEAGRFVAVIGGNLAAAGVQAPSLLGRTLWECGAVLAADGAGWNDFQATLRAGQPFAGLLFTLVNARGETRTLRCSGQPTFGADGRVGGYCGIVSDITEARRAEDLLRLEHSVNRSLAESGSAAETLRAAIRAVCEAERWECGRYFSWDEGAGILRFGECWGVPDAAIQAFIERSREIEYRPGVGLVGTVWQSGQPLWVADISKELRASRLARSDDAGIRGAFIFPLVADGKQIGALSFNSREVRAPEPRLVQAIGAIGDQIGQFVQRMQAKEVLRDSEERFRAVVDSANEGILVYDKDLRVVAGNAVAERIIGLPLAQLVGASGFTSLLPCVNESGRPLQPEDRPTQQAIRAGTAVGGRLIGIQRPGGTTTWLSVNTGFLRRPGESDFYGLVSTLSDITQQRQAEAALRESEARLRSLNKLSTDWFWEHDAGLRYRRLEGRHVSGDNSAFEAELGQTGEALGVEVDGGWPAHRALLQARKPFRDVVMWCQYGSGRPNYMSISGEPMFDAEGHYQGYRGVGVDITERQRAEQLQALEHAVNRALNEARDIQDALGQALAAICETEGWECGRYLRVDTGAGVLRYGEAWHVPNPNIECYVESLRASSYAPGVGVVGRVWQSGQPLWVSDIGQDPRAARPTLAIETGMHGAFAVPVDADGSTIGVLIFHSREIREPDAQLLQAMRVIGSQVGQYMQRKKAEQASLRLGRMFAALSETNDAILHAQSPVDLYQRVCDAVVHGGKFSSILIFVAEEGSPWARPMGGAGRVAHQLRDAQVSFDESLPQGRGLIGTAFRSAKPSVSNDYLNDERTKPWHPIARRAGCRASAALPMLQGGRSIGAVLIFDDEIDAFDDEILGLLERMVANVSFALDNFEREAEQRQAAQRIEFLATHDGLTQLPNRVLFSQVLNVAIQTARRHEREFAVLFIDLDRFKVINDTLGHAAGDTLLTEMSRRIKDRLRASDVVARLGGDEFVVLIQEVGAQEQVAMVARKLLAALQEPLVVVGQECQVTASIGISMFPADAQDEPSLMKNADFAMYLAKEEGKNNFQFYSAAIRNQSLARLSLEAGLRQALERGELSLHYQAKLELASRAVVGVEALLRWQHPELGSVSPAQFIPVAEDSGLIVAIGRWVIRAACAQNRAWQQAGLAPVCMAVNLSPRQFADEQLLDDLATALRETGMAPELLELEITESTVMANVERAARMLCAIKAMGVRLAIDDFGTGYSSLAQLKRFPIDTLKIDRSFIRDIPQDAEDMAITTAIIAMGKALGLTVVAEGVETLAQEDFLSARDCDQTQGYYFSRPVPHEQFAALLLENAAGLGGAAADAEPLRLVGGGRAVA